MIILSSDFWGWGMWFPEYVHFSCIEDAFHGEVHEVPGHVCSCMQPKCRPSLQGQKHILTPSVRSSDRLWMLLLDDYLLSVTQGYECGGSQTLIKFTTKKKHFIFNYKSIFFGRIITTTLWKLKFKTFINHLICKQCTVNYTGRCTVICLHILPDSSCRSLPINTVNKKQASFHSYEIAVKFK